MVEPAIAVEGIAEARKAFRAATGSTKELSQAHRRVAKVLEARARANAAGGTRQQAKAAKVLIGRGTSTSAALAVRNTGRVPFGLGAFLGAQRYRQFPEWVGNRWDLLAGVGPYVIAETIRDDADQILEEFVVEIGRALADAGLDVQT